MSYRLATKLLLKVALGKNNSLKILAKKLEFWINTSRSKIQIRQKSPLVVLMSINYWLCLKLVKKTKEK